MTGSQDIATQLFEDYLQKNPSDYDSLAFPGWLYLESDRVDQAEATLSKAHRIRPADLEVMFQLARVARARTAGTGLFSSEANGGRQPGERDRATAERGGAGQTETQ
jgi:tetratricopeptide (TPR) repeat protein